MSLERNIEPVPEPSPPPAPPPAPKPDDVPAPKSATTPGGRGLARVPVWVDQLADVFSWVAVAWLIAQAASWLGKDNFLVAIAMGLAAAALWPNFVEPVRRFFKAIFHEIFSAVADLIEFLGQWWEAVKEHFGGNMLRAIVRVVALAAFMWIWSLARSIPAIANLLDVVVETAAKITAWVNQAIDGLVGQVLRLRDQVLGWLDGILAKLGDVGRAIRDDVLGLVRSLFGGVARELNQLRFELLERFDIVRHAMALEVEILGQRIRLIPAEVIAQLRDQFTAAAREEEQRLREAALARRSQPVGQAAPWVVIEVAVAEVTAAMDGIPAVAGAAEEPLIEELRRHLPRAPAYLRGWLGGRIDELAAEAAKAPTSAQVYVDEVVTQVRAVLAGSPPAIPDLPRDLVPPPPPAPPPPAGS